MLVSMLQTPRYAAPLCSIHPAQGGTCPFFSCGFTLVENDASGTSLVVQWSRIRLPIQGTQVRALVREDPTCRGATKPVRHNY